MVLLFGLLYSGTQLERNPKFKKSSLPQTPIELVDNKCETNIMTIGNMKLRTPKTELFQQNVIPQEKPAK